MIQNSQNFSKNEKSFEYCLGVQSQVHQNSLDMENRVVNCFSASNKRKTKAALVISSVSLFR